MLHLLLKQFTSILTWHLLSWHLPLILSLLQPVNPMAVGSLPHFLFHKAGFLVRCYFACNSMLMDQAFCKPPISGAGWGPWARKAYPCLEYGSIPVERKGWPFQDEGVQCGSFATKWPNGLPNSNIGISALVSVIHRLNRLNISDTVVARPAC